MDRTTDRKAVRYALELAIMYEESLIDAHKGCADESGTVERSRKSIASFKRVLDRYFGGRAPDPFEGCKTISIYELLKQPPETR